MKKKDEGRGERGVAGAKESDQKATPSEGGGGGEGGGGTHGARVRLSAIPHDSDTSMRMSFVLTPSLTHLLIPPPLTQQLSSCIRVTDSH